MQATGWARYRLSAQCYPLARPAGVEVGVCTSPEVEICQPTGFALRGLGN